MTHEQAHTLLLDLAYGEVPPELARELRHHVDRCDACAAELEGIATARRLAARAADPEVPRAGRVVLVAAARRAVASRRPRWAVRPRIAALVGTAAVLALVTGVTVKVLDARSRRPGGEGMGEDAERASVPAPPPAVAPETRSPPAATAPEVLRSPPAAATAPQRTSPPARGPGSAAGATQPSSPAATGAPVARAQAERAEETPASADRSEAPYESARPTAERRKAAPQREPSAPRPGASVALSAPGAAPRAAAPATGTDAAESDLPAEARDLATEARRLTCGGVSLERIALVAPDGRIVKLTVRREGRAIADAWYGEDGRRRALRAYEPGPLAALPAHAPALEDVGSRCEW